MLPIALLVLFVLLAVGFYVAAVRLSRPRVLFEVSMEPHQWEQVRSFWQSVGRLQ